MIVDTMTYQDICKVLERDYFSRLDKYAVYKMAENKKKYKNALNKVNGKRFFKPIEYKIDNLKSYYYPYLSKKSLKSNSLSGLYVFIIWYRNSFISVFLTKPNPCIITSHAWERYAERALGMKSLPTADIIYEYLSSNNNFLKPVKNTDDRTIEKYGENSMMIYVKDGMFLGKMDDGVFVFNTYISSDMEKGNEKEGRSVAEKQINSLEKELNNSNSKNVDRSKEISKYVSGSEYNNIMKLYKESGYDKEFLRLFKNIILEIQTGMAKNCGFDIDLSTVSTEELINVHNTCYDYYVNMQRIIHARQSLKCSKKKIDRIIRENINNFLIKEVYNQLTIPFDNEYHEVNGKMIPLKMTYEYFIDWLEEHGRYGKLESNNKNFDGDDLIRGCREINPDDIIDYILDQKSEMDYEGELLSNIFKSYDFMKKEYFNIPLNDVIARTHALDYNSNFKDWLDTLEFTNMGYQYFKKCLMDNFIHEVIYSDYTFKDGLVYVERAIVIPSIKSYYKDSENGTDFFQCLEKCYDTIGECWSYRQGGGEAYGGYIKGDTIILKGWIRSEDINYWNVLYYANWVCALEDELRLDKGTLVEIDEITVQGISGETKLPLRDSIIIKV